MSDPSPFLFEISRSMKPLTLRRIRGDFGEDAAAKQLKKSGYRVVDKNFTAFGCEIDLIVKNKEYLVFVEVKTRRLDPDSETVFTKPASAVDREKQQHILRAARCYLAAHPEENKKCRFDVVEVYLDPQSKVDSVIKIHHIPGAFHA
jgi:putative endonuclease